MEKQRRKNNSDSTLKDLKTVRTEECELFFKVFQKKKVGKQYKT